MYDTWYLTNHIFCAIGANAATISSPPNTSTVGLYVEYSLLNHMCKPICGWEEKNGAISVFALEDIKAGDQLRISYLLPKYCLYLREVRRKELVDVFGFLCYCDVCLGEELDCGFQVLATGSAKACVYHSLVTLDDKRYHG